MVAADGRREREEIDARIAEARVRARDAVGGAIQALETLETLLARRQKLSRRPADLDELVQVNRHLVALTTVGSVARARRNLRLATLLGWRDNGADGPDLAEAIDLCKAAATAEGAVAFEARVEHGRALRLRFRHRWDRATLREAVTHAERLCIDTAQALTLPGADGAANGRQLLDALDRSVPEGEWGAGNFAARGAGGLRFALPQWILKEAVSIYAGLLRYRYRLDFDEQDLHDAIRGDRIALRLISRDPANKNRAWLVTSIAQSMNYQARDSEVVDDLDDLDDAIAELRRVVEHSPATETIFRGRRSTLAGLLHLKAARTRDVACVSDAIDLHQRSLHHGTGVNPVYATWQLQDLADCFLLRYRLSPRAHVGDVQMAREAGERAWGLRRGEVSVGLLDTALVYADALRLLEPDGEALWRVLETACEVLGRLERRRTFGARQVLQSLGGRYGTLRDWLIEWHARRTVRAVKRGDAAATARRVERTFKAIGLAKQRTLVAHMDVQDVRPQGASATTFDELRRIAESLPERDHGRDDAEAGGIDPPSLHLGARSSLTRDNVERQQVAELEGRLDLLGEQVATDDADAAAAWGLVPPPTVAEVARSLPPRTTMVLCYPLERETVVIGVGNWGGAWRAQLAMAPLGRTALDMFATRIFRKRDGSAVDRPDHSSMDQVLEHVAAAFLPAMAQVVPGWARATSGPEHHGAPEHDDAPGLVLVPTGPLHRMPLHALPLGPRTGAGVDRERLIDRFVVSYATTVDVLPRVSGRGAAQNGIAVLAPAAIDGDESTPHRTVAFAQALATRAAPAASLRVRHDATRDAVTDGTLDDRRLVFVAAHGRAGKPGDGRRSRGMLSGGTSTDLVDPADGVRAGILMHEGTRGTVDGRWLSVRRIVSRARLPRVEHVQLLACDTHADDPAPGDELAGLLCAFLVRGGRSVGGTLWKVDEVPAILVGWWLAAELLAGATDKAGALRRVTQRMRRATHGEVIAALSEIRDAAASSPLGIDPQAREALGESIRIASEASPHEITELWQLHHWSPYVLHGAPQVRATR